MELKKLTYFKCYVCSFLFLFFSIFLAGIGKKLYICGVNWRENLPIGLKYGVYISY